MNLTESKSNLARLMSEENLLVEQRSGVRSAFFDTKNRLLVVPKFKDDLSSDCLDLMLSHEVGHSLNTPVDWVDVCKTKSLNHTIVNVVEDSRIERLVKQKYPGLRSIYYRAYKELSNSDFFGLSKVEDLSSLNLIDKINLYCKIGFLSFIEFNDEEKVLLHKVETTETFTDTINVSLEIQKYIKEQLEKQYEEESEGLGENKPSFGGYEPFESITSDATPSLGQTENGEQESKSKDKGSYDSTLPNFIDGDELGTLEEFIQSNLKSFTQEEAEIKKEELYSESNKDSMYVDIPDIKLSDYVEDYKVLYDKLSVYFNSAYNDWYSRKQIPFVLDQTLYNKFKVENSTVVSYLIKEFNLKKNAQGRKKAKISKTGDIHLNKLYSYKISEDIFKRSTSIPKSQSHGLVFFLDWSGSMVDWINDTIKQLLTMLMFCRKQNIPFEVYAFSTYYPGSSTPTLEKEMILKPLRLFNVFSSRMTNTEFVYASNCLLNFDGYRFGPYNGPVGSWVYPPEWFALGNTPLNHSIFVSKKIVEEFQTRTRVQIVNSIYLTDGESHGIGFYTNQNGGYARNYSLETEFYNIYLRDKKTKETLLIKPRNRIQETNACVKFTKQISNFRMFAFRLANANDLRRNVYSYFGYDADRASKLREFNRDNCLEVPSEFDKFYFVKGNLLNKEETLSNDFDGKTVSTMSKEFAKVMGNKVNTRLFLSKFIEFIS